MNHLDLIPSEQGTSHCMDKIWVQCESLNCLKWRLIPKDDSKLDLNAPWFCHMSPDPVFNQCTAPQATLPKDSQLKGSGLKMVFSLLPVGSVVLVKAATWPWWPVVLSPDPSTEEYVKRDREGHVESYHVEFLGSPHTRCWTSVKRVESKHLKGALRKSFEKAFEEAAKIQGLDCEERLTLCHFKVTDAVLGQAQRLLRAIQGMIRQCSTEGSFFPHGGVDQASVASGLEDVGDSLLIDGFRFESALSKEALMKLRKI